MDMSPMASGIADGEEYGFVFGGGFGKGGVAPWHPVDGVVGVLEQVGGFFVDEGIGFFIGKVRGHREPP